MVCQFGSTSLHGTAGDKYGGNVQAQGGVEHPRCDLVAVRDANERIGAVGVNHIFDGVSDNIPRWQAIEHPVVTHGDAVVYGDGIKFLGNAASFLDFPSNQLTHILEVHVARYKLGEGISDGNNGFLEIAVRHARRAP